MKAQEQKEMYVKIQQKIELEKQKTQEKLKQEEFLDMLEVGLK